MPCASMARRYDGASHRCSHWSVRSAPPHDSNGVFGDMVMGLWSARCAAPKMPPGSITCPSASNTRRPWRSTSGPPCREPAVERDDGAGDVRRARRAEERDGVGDLACQTETPHRRVLGDHVDDLLWVGL